MENSTINDYAAGLTEDESISRPMRLGILDDLHSQNLIGGENTIKVSQTSLMNHPSIFLSEHPNNATS